jgi:hypothetical protein
MGIPTVFLSITALLYYRKPPPKNKEEANYKDNVIKVSFRK